MNDSGISINLLPREEKGSLGAVRLFRKATIFLILALVASGGLAIGMWSFTLMTQKDIVAEGQKIGLLQQQITKLSDREQKIHLLANRMSGITTILKKRTLLEEQLNGFLASLPDGVAVSQAMVGDGTSGITLRIVSQTYEGFSKFMTLLESGGFSRVDIVSLARNAKGEYHVTAEVTLQ